MEKYYNTDGSCGSAQLDQLETKKTGSDVYLLPKGATFTPPPQISQGEQCRLENGGWVVSAIPKAIDPAIQAEAQAAAELQARLDAQTTPSPRYAVFRREEYLPMSEYMDAKAKQTSSDPVIVAEGVQQEADFHAGNLAVKAKYPKPV